MLKTQLPVDSQGSGPFVLDVPPFPRAIAGISQTASSLCVRQEPGNTDFQQASGAGSPASCRI